MDYLVKKAIEREVERLEQVKKEYPKADETWMYEPDLSELKRKLEEGK